MIIILFYSFTATTSTTTCANPLLSEVTPVSCINYICLKKLCEWKNWLPCNFSNREKDVNGFLPYFAVNNKKNKMGRDFVQCSA